MYELPTLNISNCHMKSVFLTFLKKNVPSGAQHPHFGLHSRQPLSTGCLLTGHLLSGSLHSRSLHLGLHHYIAFSYYLSTSWYLNQRRTNERE